SLEADNFHGWRLNASLDHGTQRQHEITDGLVDFPSLAAALTGTPQTAFKPFGDGSQASPSIIPPIQSSPRYSSQTDEWDLELTGDRSLLRLRTGEVSLGLGAAWRKERLNSVLRESKSAPRIGSDLSRTIGSASGDLTLPLPGHAGFTASGRL